MTNIRTSGFDSPAQMREYLEEVDDVDSAVGTGQQDAAIIGAIRELRGQIDELRQQLEGLPWQGTKTKMPESGWLGVIAMATISMALGRTAGRLRLGVLAAVAAPLVLLQFDRTS